MILLFDIISNVKFVYRASQTRVVLSRARCRRDPQSLLLISASSNVYATFLASLHGRTPTFTTCHSCDAASRGYRRTRAISPSEGDLSERAGQDLPLRLKGFVLEPRVAIVPPRSYRIRSYRRSCPRRGIECHGRKRVVHNGRTK